MKGGTVDSFFSKNFRKMELKKFSESCRMKLTFLKMKFLGKWSRMENIMEYAKIFRIFLKSFFKLLYIIR